MTSTALACTVKNYLRVVENLTADLRVKNNVLYAYNYDKGNERVETIPLETTDQITMLKFDLTMEPMKDALFIATYNTAEGGTLRKYYVGNNPDKVELKADPTAVWKGLTKVKNMSWRAVL